jgi:hypothetical protein
MDDAEERGAALLDAYATAAEGRPMREIAEDAYVDLRRYLEGEGGPPLESVYAEAEALSERGLREAIGTMGAEAEALRARDQARLGTPESLEPEISWAGLFAGWPSPDRHTCAGVPWDYLLVVTPPAPPGGGDEEPNDGEGARPTATLLAVPSPTERGARWALSSPTGVTRLAHASTPCGDLGCALLYTTPAARAVVGATPYADALPSLVTAALAWVDPAVRMTVDDVPPVLIHAMAALSPGVRALAQLPPGALDDFVVGTYERGDPVFHLWFTPCQLEALLGTAIGHHAARAVSRYRTAADEPTLLGEAARALARQPLGVPWEAVPEELHDRIALAIWEHACQEDEPRATADGPDDGGEGAAAAAALGAHRLVDVARLWGLEATDAERTQPRLLCGPLAVDALARAVPDARAHLPAPIARRRGHGALTPFERTVIMFACGRRSDTPFERADDETLLDKWRRIRAQGTTTRSLSPDTLLRANALYGVDRSQRPDALPHELQAFVSFAAERLGVPLEAADLADAGSACRALAPALALTFS